jgi:hypothetical protein
MKIVLLGTYIVICFATFLLSLSVIVLCIEFRHLPKRKLLMFGFSLPQINYWGRNSVLMVILEEDNLLHLVIR